MTDKYGRMTEREKSDVRCYWMGSEQVWRDDVEDYDYKCFHPLNFCYCFDDGRGDEGCEHYQPNHEPSDTEEEVRQFLEYTEK